MSFLIFGDARTQSGLGNRTGGLGGIPKAP